MEAMAFNQNVSICWLHVLMNLLIAITDLLLIIRYMIHKIVPIYMNICEYIKYGGYMNYGEYTNNAGYVNYGVYVNCGEYVKYDGYVNYSGYMNYGRYMNYGEIYAVFCTRNQHFAMDHRPKTEFDVGLRTRDECHFFHQRIVDRPSGGVNVTLLAYVKNNKAVLGLQNNMFLFHCLTLHRGCDVRRLEPAVGTLYDAYDREDVVMRDFTRVTLDDLYRVETTCETNVCVRKIRATVILCQHY